ncbi:MAG TPA: DUF1161 domain-containing protein, partial [Albitalea sp.]|nr:DUF1161 domain-containing protein [Albitalea sp.]
MKGVGAWWRSVAMMVPAAVSMGMAGTAQAQAPAGPCDVLKATLAARIEATGVRGYSLEAVPGRTPVPSGAKVIGTCEGGATKMLYRRWAIGQAAGGAASATSAA